MFVGHCVFNSQHSRLETQHKNQIDYIKKGKDSVIQANYHQIHNLTLSLDRINKSLTMYESKIDSLESVKKKVQIVYKIKYKEIETLSDTGIVNYWINEFNGE